MLSHMTRIAQMASEACQAVDLQILEQQERLNQPGPVSLNASFQAEANRVFGCYRQVLTQSNADYAKQIEVLQTFFTALENLNPSGNSRLSVVETFGRAIKPLEAKQGVYEKHLQVFANRLKALQTLESPPPLSKKCEALLIKIESLPQ
jgi:hypothetical protein